jgi:UDP-N-acetylmuramoyl-L-alanyl-D-glutamate--2,6-diaminopimelate ligase
MIQSELTGAPHEIVLDRREAIFRAVAMARPRDIILIAGKGHETYQEFADHTLPFDDLEVARWALEATPASKI